GLPLAYNSDMQEDKEPFFDSADTLEAILGVLPGLLSSLSFKTDRMRAAAGESFATATDLADYLVRRGLPFRQAHEVVGRVVRYGLDQGKTLDALTLGELRRGAGGKKAAPVNPALRVPVPVTDLRGEVHDGAVELAWTNPTRRADNTRLRDIVAARVYRTEDEGVGDPRPALLVRGRIAGYTELLTLTAMPGPPGAMTKPLLTGALVQVTDRQGLIEGRYYTYVVIVEDAEGRVSPPSSRVSVTFGAAPDAPQGLTAAPG